MRRIKINNNKSAKTMRQENELEPGEWLPDLHIPRSKEKSSRRENPSNENEVKPKQIIK